MLARTLIATLTITGCIASQAPSTCTGRETESSIVGTWEGIRTREPRYILIEFTKKNTARIVMIIGSTPHNHIAKYICHTYTVKNHAISMQCHDTKEDIQRTIEVRGQIITLNDSGRIDAKFTFPSFEDISNTPTTHHVDMHKTPGGYIEELLKMKNLAKKLMKAF